TLIGGLDQRVHAIAVRRRDRDVDLAEGRPRHAAPFDLLPRRAAVAGDVDAAARPARELGPRVHLDLPRAGDEHARILRVHRQPRAAGVLVDEQDAVPVRAGVGRAEDAALLLPAGPAPFGADEHRVGIRRMDDHARDATGLVEAGVRPRLSRVERFVDAVADDVAVANRPRLARPGPDDVRVAGRDGERADGGDGDVVGD